MHIWAVGTRRASLATAGAAGWRGRLDYVRTGGAPLLRGRRLTGLAGLTVICSGSREKLDS